MALKAPSAGNGVPTGFNQAGPDGIVRTWPGMDCSGTVIRIVIIN
jgi:hypothetical protein